MATHGKIYPRKRAFRAFGIRQRILNGNPHIRLTHLCDDCAILIFHRGMDNALRMHQNLNLIYIYIKQPFRLHHFQALIHQRCRINRNLLAHVPVRVRQCIRRRYMLQLLAFFATEGAAGGCQQNTRNAVVCISL